MSKRILMIIDGLPGGGAEKVVLTLAEGLLAMGHRVSLFSLRSVCDYAIPAGLDYQVVKDHCHTPWRKLTELQRRANQLDSTIRAAEQAEGDFDLVFSHLHKTDRIARRCHHLNPEKVWFCLHGVFSLSYLSRRKGFSRWLKRMKTRHIYHHRNLIAVSDYVLKDLEQHYDVQPAQSRVIANPFDINAILRLAEEPCAMAGTDYLLHIGRIHETKRQDRLIHAYALSHIQAPLVIIGQGDKLRTERLKQLAKKLNVSDRVIFQGFMQNPYPWIKHAHMLVASSDSEGFGNVLVEALICHTAVVSTRAPGGTVSILQGELARGLAELNAESLAEKMNDIYRNPPDMNKIDLSRYSLETICLQYLSLATPGQNGHEHTYDE